VTRSVAETVFFNRYDVRQQI